MWPCSEDVALAERQAALGQGTSGAQPFLAVGPPPLPTWRRAATGRLHRAATPGGYTGRLHRAATPGGYTGRLHRATDPSRRCCARGLCAANVGGAATATVVGCGCGWWRPWLVRFCADGRVCLVTVDLAVGSAAAQRHAVGTWTSFTCYPTARELAWWPCELAGHSSSDRRGTCTGQFSSQPTGMRAGDEVVKAMLEGGQAAVPAHPLLGVCSQPTG